MGGISQAHAKDALNHILGVSSHTQPASLELRLYEVGHGTTALTEADLAGNELTVAGYAAQAITFAAAADAEATRGAISKSSNTPTFTASSGSQAFDAWAIYDNGGSLRYWGEAGDLAGVVDTGGYTFAAGEIAVMMKSGALSAYAQKKWLDHSLNVALWTMPSSHELALYSTGEATPVEADLAGNELAGSGYASEAISFSGATNSGAGGQSANVGAVEYATASGAWAEYDVWAVTDGINVLVYGPETSPVTVGSGRRLVLPSGAIVVTLGPD